MRQARGIMPPLLGLGVDETIELILRHCEHVGNVEPVGRTDLDTDGRDQDKPVDAMRGLGRHDDTNHAQPGSPKGLGQGWGRKGVAVVLSPRRSRSIRSCEVPMSIL